VQTYFDILLIIAYFPQIGFDNCTTVAIYVQCSIYMKIRLLAFFILSLLIVILIPVTHAKWSCEAFGDDPTLQKCIDKGAQGSNESLKVCLEACKTDPRYNLRNFSPFLNFPDIGSVVTLGLNLVTVIAGLVCGAISFYGAYEYLSANGDSKKTQTARSRITYAMIGLVIILVSYAIVKTILTVTSTNTIDF
jgi:hypothetical protein